MEKLKYHHDYHQSLVYKITNGTKPDNVVYTFEQSLEIIKNVHDMTGGLKQIIYLVGWQYDGHDSKYPAFFEVNERLKRDCDKDARESMIWLMNEAKKYNAVVSTHINLCDAYENSPLWDEYMKQDLMVREADGSLQKGGIWDGEQSYRVSKTREWAAGLTQERIKKFLELLPIAETGTVHIDAFFPKPSAFHGVTMDDEIKTIQEILKYWHTCGVDVTGELFIHAYAGLFPMAWHLNLDEASRLKYPADVLCGGGPGWNARHHTDAEQVTWVGVYTAPEAGCLYDEAWGYTVDEHAGLLGEMPKFSAMFYINTVPWLLMNQRGTVRHIHDAEFYTVEFGDDLVSTVRKNDRHHTITDSGKLIVDGSDVFAPAVWLDDKYMAYSQNGATKTWELPESWKQATTVRMQQVYPIGEKAECSVPVVDGKVTIKLAAGQAAIVSKA